MATKKGSKKSSSRSGGSVKGGASKRGSSKRELIAPRGDKRFVRRDSQGQFKESDDVSRSLSADRRRVSATAAKAGQGDRGDRARSKKN